ncbi:alpha/beta hydrolase [Dyadobacter tibetensis]|uniref:alpha/beta hydrolase n=1 Tax=Dyadobacter tibetensis TaxID=1211851 RepID=UPI00046F29BD|nr:phospholipase [Dyadobacter tibetensis]
MNALDRAMKRGAPLEHAEKAMIMIHGRGATAQGILDLYQYFDYPHIAYLAPQAEGGSWYPKSFMAPLQDNEPGISRGLATIDELMVGLEDIYGLLPRDIYLLGFSQGACLSLEYVARHAREYAGIFGLSGGLIGPDETKRDYLGSLADTPVLLGCSDVDFHIPRQRVEESGAILQRLGAKVTVQLYPDFGHNIHDNEIDYINSILKK